MKNPILIGEAEEIPEPLNLALVQDMIEAKLTQIEKIIGPNYTLALICKAKPECGDADIILTMLDRSDILKVVDRFLPAKPQP